ncbi:hypothetical protein AKO1_007233 [Acrasis kona]|uniref:Uncharacterized protein n=1 Tax=Acrasis kona TaxID=1008807 RepID=A0AAW2YS25_9EUKA
MTTQHKPISELCSSKKRKKLNQILAPALMKFGVGAEQLLSINDVRKILKTKSKNGSQSDQTLTDEDHSLSPTHTMSTTSHLVDHQQPQSEMECMQVGEAELGFSNFVAQDKTDEQIEVDHKDGWLQSDANRESNISGSMRDILNFNILSGEEEESKENEIDKLVSPTTLNSTNGNSTLIMQSVDKDM